MYTMFLCVCYTLTCKILFEGSSYNSPTPDMRHIAPYAISQLWTNGCEIQNVLRFLQKQLYKVVNNWKSELVKMSLFKEVWVNNKINIDTRRLSAASLQCFSCSQLPLNLRTSHVITIVRILPQPCHLWLQPTVCRKRVTGVHQDRISFMLIVIHKTTSA